MRGGTAFCSSQASPSHQFSPGAGGSQFSLQSRSRNISRYVKAQRILAPAHSLPLQSHAAAELLDCILASQRLCDWSEDSVTQCDPNQCFSLIRAFSSRLVGTCSTASGIIRCSVPLANLSLDLTSWPGMESYENIARHECCCSV